MNPRPRVSVVTPVYRSRRWLAGYAAALRALDLGGDALEVILVDNDPRAMSLEEYTEILDGLDVRVLSNDRNEGFARACNRGVREARGELILFLNVDTEVGPDVYRLLSRRLEGDPGCAAVEARLEPTPHPKFVWPGTGRVEWCSACCMLMRREIFLQVGGFDEIFFMYGEDVDLSFRLRDRGFRLACVEEARCVHHDEAKDPAAVQERARHLARAEMIMRARYGGVAHALLGAWLASCRALARRRTEPLAPVLGGLVEGLGALPRVLADRWSAIRFGDGPRRRLVGDDGSFSLHFSFPAPPRPESSAPWTPPAFSVVVATENRDLVVEPLVEALLKQIETLGAGELLVVDHGSSPGVAEGLRARYGTKSALRVLEQPRATAPEARSAAVAASTGDVVIFLDEDLVPDEGFLEAHLRAQGEAEVVQGPILARWPLGGCPFLRFARTRAAADEEPSALVAFDGRRFSTANASVRRALLDEVALPPGVFARRLCDDAADIDLGLRLARAGARWAWEPGTVVLRRDLPTAPAFLAAAFRRGQAAAILAGTAPSAALALGAAPDTVRSLLRAALFHATVGSALAVPALALDVLAPPRWRSNALADWWFTGLFRLAQGAGFVWERTRPDARR